LDLDRYCNLLALDLDEIMAHPQSSKISTLSSTTVSLYDEMANFSDLVDVENNVDSEHNNL